jgi:nucleotide-binding universal stress UspA family protein
MTALPAPDDLTSLVLRTDFSDDAAWDELRAVLRSEGAHRSATYVSDPAYAGATIEALVEADAAADEDDKLTYLFLADDIALNDDEHLLIAVDLAEEPGRTFRVQPGAFTDVSANLAIANMEFADFADAADDSGTFRGFE